MLRRLVFLRRSMQARFAEALAQLRPGRWAATGAGQWACYRLGLYATVAASAWDGKHVLGGFAVTVSLAACGRADEAEALAYKVASLPDAAPHIADMADALAPFAPALSLALIERREAATALRAALLLRTGHMPEAAGLLAGALQHGEAQHNAELCLLCANANVSSLAPAAQLRLLNDFLSSFRLSPLALTDGRLPPSPGNLRPAMSPQCVDDGPVVSVLMTAYQAVDRIAAAIDGVLAQTYRAVELIVIDDASTDGTGDVVCAIAARDARVKYLRLPRNGGTFVAKMVGLRHATGEFVTCHDSDDWSHPSRIERQVLPLLLDRKLVATTSQWVRMEDSGVYYARPVHPLMRLNPASPLFRRKEVLARAGTWDAVRTGADSEFIARLRLVFGKRAVRKVAEPLAFGAHRPDSLMTAADTGYGEGGISPTRLAYWEAWTKWHIAELRAGRRPAWAPTAGRCRPFEAPDAIVVPQEIVDECLVVERTW
jgi:hypothetical protein